jgi:hypothetical protein
MFSTSSSVMAILNEPSEQTPAALGGPAAPGLPRQNPLTRKNVPATNVKNQPFATIAQIRPWNRVDRAR